MKCKNCGREFEIDHYGQKYCSLECYEDKSYRNIKNYKKRLIEEPNTKIEERKKKRTKGITIARAQKLEKINKQGCLLVYCIIPLIILIISVLFLILS